MASSSSEMSMEVLPSGHSVERWMLPAIEDLWNKSGRRWDVLFLVQDLSLSHICMEDFPQRLLACFTHLTHLNLSHNSISNISGSLFLSSCPNLHALDISWNLLSDFDMIRSLHVLDQLQEFHFEGNPLPQMPRLTLLQSLLFDAPSRVDGIRVLREAESMSSWLDLFTLRRIEVDEKKHTTSELERCNKAVFVKGVNVPDNTPSGIMSTSKRHDRRTRLVQQDDTVNLSAIRSSSKKLKQQAGQSSGIGNLGIHPPPSVGDSLRCPRRLDMKRFLLMGTQSKIRSKTLAAQEQLRLLVADAPVGTYRDHFYVLRHLNGEKITMEEMNQVMRSFSMEAIQIAHEIPLKDRVASTLSTQREPVLEIPFDPSQAGISLFSGDQFRIQKNSDADHGSMSSDDEFTMEERMQEEALCDTISLNLRLKTISIDPLTSARRDIDAKWTLPPEDKSLTRVSSVWRTSAYDNRICYFAESDGAKQKQSPSIDRYSLSRLPGHEQKFSHARPMNVPPLPSARTLERVQQESQKQTSWHVDSVSSSKPSSMSKRSTPPKESSKNADSTGGEEIPMSELMVTITATPRSPNLPSLSKSQPILFQSPTFRERSGSMLRLDAESPRAADSLNQEKSSHRTLPHASSRSVLELQVPDSDSESEIDSEYDEDYGFDFHDSQFANDSVENTERADVDADAVFRQRSSHPYFLDPDFKQRMERHLDVPLLEEIHEKLMRDEFSSLLSGRQFSTLEHLSADEIRKLTSNWSEVVQSGTSRSVVHGGSNRQQTPSRQGSVASPLPPSSLRPPLFHEMIEETIRHDHDRISSFSSRTPNFVRSFTSTVTSARRPPVAPSSPKQSSSTQVPSLDLSVLHHSASSQSSRRKQDTFSASTPQTDIQRSSSSRSFGSESSRISHRAETYRKRAKFSLTRMYSEDEEYEDLVPFVAPKDPNPNAEISLPSSRYMQLPHSVAKVISSRPESLPDHLTVTEVPSERFLREQRNRAGEPGDVHSLALHMTPAKNALRLRRQAILGPSVVSGESRSHRSGPLSPSTSRSLPVSSPQVGETSLRVPKPPQSARQEPTGRSDRAAGRHNGTLSGKEMIYSIQSEHRRTEIELNIDDLERLTPRELPQSFFDTIEDRQRQRMHQSIIAKKLSLHKKRLSLIENGKLTHASRLYEQAMQTFLKPEATQFNRNDRREKVISDDPTLRLLRDTEKDNIRKIWWKGSGVKQGKQADHRYSEDAGTHEQRPSGKNSEGQIFETGKMSMVSDVVRDMMTTSEMVSIHGETFVYSDEFRSLPSAPKDQSDKKNIAPRSTNFKSFQSSKPSTSRSYRKGRFVNPTPSTPSKLSADQPSSGTKVEDSEERILDQMSSELSSRQAFVKRKGAARVLAQNRNAPIPERS